MGLIHGITNLGGALLTAKVFNSDLNKYQKRATIAISYMTFAIFQLITITFLENNFSYYNPNALPQLYICSTTVISRTPTFS